MTKAQFDAEAERDEALKSTDTAQAQLTERRQEVEREVRKKKALEREKNVLKHELDKTHQQVDLKHKHLEDLQQDLTRLHDTCNERKHTIEHMHVEAEGLLSHNHKLERQKGPGERDGTDG